MEQIETFGFVMHTCKACSLHFAQSWIIETKKNSPDHGKSREKAPPRGAAHNIIPDQRVCQDLLHILRPGVCGLYHYKPLAYNKLQMEPLEKEMPFDNRVFNLVRTWQIACIRDRYQTFFAWFFSPRGWKIPPSVWCMCYIEDMNKGVFVDVSAKGMFRG